MFAIKVRTVCVDHPGEAEGLILDLVKLLEAAHQPLLHALFFFLQIVLAIDCCAHIHAAEKIMIFTGHGTEYSVGSQVLKVGLNHRSAARQHLD